MVFSANNGSVISFFDSFENVLRRYADSRNGQFTIVCSSSQEGASRLYNLGINGFSPDPFRFSSENLSRMRNNNTSNAVYSFSKDRIVNILETTGYGEANFAFDKGKNNQLILTCRSTISYRKVFYL